MNWQARIRAAFGPMTPDADIIEDLAQHAEATYAARRADGASEANAIARVDEQIAEWTVDPSVFHRRARRAAAVVPPGPASRGIGLLQDVKYAARLLRRRPAYAASRTGSGSSSSAAAATSSGNVCDSMVLPARSSG